MGPDLIVRVYCLLFTVYRLGLKLTCKTVTDLTVNFTNRLFTVFRLPFTVKSENVTNFTVPLLSGCNPDWRDRNGPEAVGEGEHHHRHAREVGRALQKVDKRISMYKI